MKTKKHNLDFPVFTSQRWLLLHGINCEKQLSCRHLKIKLFMTKKIEHYLPFYLGCRTNIGKVIGIVNHIVFTESADGGVVQHDTTQAGFSITLFLRRLRDISDAESLKLIEKGFSIGRPKGYSFSPDAFLYLLSLQVDLFNLINSELAIDINNKSH